MGTVVAWMTQHGGGYAPGAWYPAALLVLASVIAVVRPNALSALPRPGRWSMALFASFVAWSYLSIAWAHAQGDAWDAGNRAVLYLTVFAVFAGLGWRRGEATAVLSALAVVTAGLGVAAVIGGLTGYPSNSFSSGRLAGPIGYEN